MARYFFSPSRKARQVVIINKASLAGITKFLEGCDSCTEPADIPFLTFLDRVTGNDSRFTDYILEVEPKCKACGSDLDEKTLVNWADAA